MLCRVIISLLLNSLTTKKADDKIFVCKFKKKKKKKKNHPVNIIFRIQRLRTNCVDLDEVAHYEPPHQDLRCLQIQLFSSLVLKELIIIENL